MTKRLILKNQFFRSFSICSIILFWIIGSSLSCSRKLIHTNQIINQEKLKVLNQNGDLIIEGDCYDLKGKTLNLKNRLIFRNGGSICNGILVGVGCQIISENGKKQIFDKIKIQGDWQISKSYLYWFTDGRNPKENFEGLQNAINLGGTCILDKMYNIAASDENSCFDTPNDIILRGLDKTETGLILMTKHKQSNGYFKHDYGNNISLESMTIASNDFIQRRKPDGDNYYFAWSYYYSRDLNSKPNMQFLKIINCNILGAVKFMYSVGSGNTTPKEMLSSGIDTIQVRNCLIEESTGLIELSNGRYDLVEIKNNTIKNIYGTVFYFPLGSLEAPFSPTELSSLRKMFIFSENKVFNEKLIYSLGEGYMSSFVVKGANIFVKGNTFENLLNDNDLIETVPFYTSSIDKTEIYNNVVKNCLGRGCNPEVGGSNSFLRIRGSRNVMVKDNIFSFDGSALQKLGLIKSLDDNIINMDISKFRFSLWSANLNGDDFKAKYLFENNQFSPFVLCDHSILSRSNVVFKNNQFTIDYLLNAEKSNWGTSGNIYDGCIIVLRDKTKDAKLIFDNNKVVVKNSNTNSLSIIKDVADNKNYEFVQIKNNKFYYNGEVSVALSKSKIIELDNSHMGLGSITFNDPTINNPEKSYDLVDLKSYAENYISYERAPVHFKITGSSTIIAKNNLDSIINLMNFRFQDVYSNKKLKETPIVIVVDAKYKLFDGKDINDNYEVVVGSFSKLFFKDQISKITEIAPFWTVRGSKYRYMVSRTDGKLSKYPLIITSTFKNKSIDNNGFLLISNASDIKSFEIKLTVIENNGQRDNSFLFKHALMNR